MNIDGTRDREIYRRQPWDSFWMIKWVQGGRALLLGVPMGTGKGIRYVALPVDGGDVEEVWRSGEAGLVLICLPTSDSSCSSRPAPGQATSDLAIVDRRSGEETRLLTHPADDSSPRWTPDGRAIVFLSDRLGGSGLFVLPVSEGRPVGDPTLIRDLGRSTVALLGFATDGSLFLRMITHWVDAYRSTVDMSTGVIGAPARLDSRSIEETGSPDWSPDGGRVAYISGSIGRVPNQKAHVVIRRADGRLERELPGEVSMGRNARLRWSPDGGHLAVRYAPIALRASCIWSTSRRGTRSACCEGSPATSRGTGTGAPSITPMETRFDAATLRQQHPRLCSPGAERSGHSTCRDATGRSSSPSPARLNRGARSNPQCGRPGG